MQGTPGGAAAKQVAKLSMQKLRDLQQQLQSAEERASCADRQSGELSASLGAAQSKLAAATAEAAARSAETAGLAARLRQQTADMKALQSRVQEEEEGRRTATTQVMVSGQRWLPGLPVGLGAFQQVFGTLPTSPHLPALPVRLWRRRWRRPVARRRR